MPFPSCRLLPATSPVRRGWTFWPSMGPMPSKSGRALVRSAQRGSAARYGHSTGAPAKVAPEGVESLKEASGPVDVVLSQLIGGIQSGLGYLGAANLAQLREKARFIRVSPAGMREAATHDVVEVKTGAGERGQ